MQIDSRKKLLPIIHAVLFCGRQGITLRSLQDHGPLSAKMAVENHGNFRTLLRFSSESNDGSHIQNEIIEADETTNVRDIEQLVLCVQFVKNQNGEYCIQEDFLHFVAVNDVTGKGLANILKHLGINISYLSGQGASTNFCDSASMNS